MESIINQAISLCEVQIHDNPMLILSESDFERLLAQNISTLINTSKDKEIKKYAVHTQISYYSENFDRHPKYRVDILVIDHENIEESPKKHKGFIYTPMAFAIEVKYFHEKDRLSKINSDFKKVELLMPNKSHLFVVALLEYKNDASTAKLNGIYSSINPKSSENERKYKYLHFNILYKQTRTQGNGEQG